MRRSASLSGWILAVAIAATLGTALATVAPAGTSERDAKALAKADYIYIATVRKDGNQSKAVPVWFVMGKHGEILVHTSPTSWKAKRIRRGSPALVWIGTADGPAFVGKAELTTDKEAQAQIIDGIPKKYLTARVGLFRPSQAKLDSGESVIVRIVPARDLAEKFRSQPGKPAPPLEPAPASNKTH